MDPIQKYGRDYIDGCRESNSRTDANFGNGDGRLQANELALDMTSLFLKDSKLAQRGIELYKKVESLAQRYAFEDGTICPAAKADLINSQEWNDILTEYKGLDDEQTYFQSFRGTDVQYSKERGYYNQGKEALQRIDEMFGNSDGRVTIDEYFQNSWSLYKDLFKDNPAKMIKSYFIAARQAQIMTKYAGPDGVLMPGEYGKGLNSEEYGKTLDVYWDLMGGRPQ